MAFFPSHTTAIRIAPPRGFRWAKLAAKTIMPPKATTFSDHIVSNTRSPHPRHDLRAFQLQHDPTMAFTDVGGTITAMKLHASKILSALGDAQSELVGRAVVLTDGKAGTVENVWLDELHGLRISLRGHDGKWPISTLKFEQPAQDGFS